MSRVGRTLSIVSTAKTYSPCRTDDGVKRSDEDGAGRHNDGAGNVRRITRRRSHIFHVDAVVNLIA